MAADTPPPDRDRRDLRVIDPPAGEPSEPHAAFEKQGVYERGRGRAAIFKAMLAFVLIAGSAAVIGYAYVQSRTSQERFDAAATPVVRPAEGPIKVRPEEPGGATVPYQDTLLLNRNDGEEVLQRPPKPSEPAIDWEAVTPEDGTELGEGSQAGPEAPATVTRRPGTKPATPASDRADEPAADTQTAAGDTGAGAFAVQIAAVREKEAARAFRQRMQRRYPDVLGDLEVTVQRAELADRGVFWRVRGGSFASREAAESLCARLKAEGQGCFVVDRP